MLWRKLIRLFFPPFNQMKTISVYKTVLKLQKGKIRLLPNCNRSHALPLDQQMAKLYTALHCFSLVQYFAIVIFSSVFWITVLASWWPQSWKRKMEFLRRFCHLLYHCLCTLSTMLTSHRCSNPKNHRTSCTVTVGIKPCIFLKKKKTSMTHHKLF